MEQAGGVNAESIGQWILVAAFILSVVSSLVVLWNGQRTQRRQVTMEADMATRAEVQKVENELADWKRQVVSKGEENRREWKEDVNELHSRITQVQTTIGSAVTGLQTETRLFNQGLAQIGDKLDRFIQRRKED